MNMFSQINTTEPGVDVTAAPPMPTFEITGPTGAVKRITLTSESAVVGRSADCELQLDHPMVSRAHARVHLGTDGRWRLTDQNSHNGTRINGQPITEVVLSDGERIHIGPFMLQLTIPYESGLTMTRDSSGIRSLGLSDEAGVIQTLREVEPPKLALEQLKCLDEFSRRVLEMSLPADRLLALCQVMLHQRFGALWAVAVRIESDGVDARPLCPMQINPHATAAPRLSRSLIRAAQVRREPVLASTRRAAPGADSQGIELSIIPEMSPMAAIAIPLPGGPVGGIDLLCAGFAPEYGTGEWLALCALAVHHYRQAEGVWANIASNRKLATLEADLDRARRVQDRLVPKECDLPGLDVAVRFSPCQGVAGDYVDALQLPNGQALLVVADVCGKGLPAAMVAMGVHTLVHAAARRWAGLSDLAVSINAHLCDTLAPESFVTFLAMTIDHTTGDIEVVNGGHPAAAAVDANGAIRRVGFTAGFPLGLMGQNLEVSRDRLGEYETMLLFTDGCYELFDAGNQMLGPAEFCALAAPAIAAAANATTAADEVTTLLDRWQGGADPTDDRTLMLVRRRKTGDGIAGFAG